MNDLRKDKIESEIKEKFIMINNADHIEFIENCILTRSKKYIPREEVNIILTEMIDLLKSQLKGEIKLKE